MWLSPEELRRLQAEAIEKAVETLKTLPISDVLAVAEGLKDPARWPRFQSATGGPAAALLRYYNLRVRVAEWEVVNGRCEHKRYIVGTTTRAKEQRAEGETWLEGWIA